MASGNYQLAVEHVKSARLFVEIDQSRSKNLQFAIAIYRERAWPSVVGADFPLDYFRGLIPVDATVFAGELGRVSGERIVLPGARRVSTREQT